MISAAGLIIALAATVVVALVFAGHGDDPVGVVLSTLTSFYPDEVIPRLVLAALFSFGVYMLVRSESPRRVSAMALACAVTGLVAGAVVIVQTEIAFARVFPEGGAALGWAPGAARVEFLPASYLVAWVQMSLGFAASTLLIAVSRLRRRAQT